MKLAKYKMKRFSTKNTTEDKITAHSDRFDQKSKFARREQIMSKFTRKEIMQ